MLVRSRPEVKQLWALSLCSCKMLPKRIGEYKCSLLPVTISATANPHKRASSVHIERPKISVPCQNLFAPASGPTCNS